MPKNKLIQLECLLSLLGAIGMLTWWIMMPLFLPVADAADNFQNLVLDDSWVVVNMVGLVSLVLFTLGFPGIYLYKSDAFRSHAREINPCRGMICRDIIARIS